MHVLLRRASILLAASFVLSACSDNDTDNNGGAQLTDFAVAPLLSDQSGAAPNTDPDLVNAWGLAMDSQSFWIAANGTGVVDVIAADGTPSKFAPPGTSRDLIPGISGIVTNTTGGFVIGTGNALAPAHMLVASETGQIFAINPDVAGTPQLVIDRSGDGAVYKGLAVFTTSGGAVRLAAADFRNRRIDVFDDTFNLIVTVAFIDPASAGLSPFNIVTIGNTMFVMYAVPNGDGTDDVPGAGNGRIDAFDLDGNYIQTVLDGGLLNAPWGLVEANSDFEPTLSGLLIAGNFGDGTIVTIDPNTGDAARLRDTSGNSLVIDGLWGLMFGNGQAVGSTSALYFTAGPAGESHGLFGRIVQTTLQ